MNWIVFVKNGYTMLMSPSGEVFGPELKGILITEADNPSMYRGYFMVEVVSDEEEAMKLIEKRQGEAQVQKKD